MSSWFVAPETVRIDLGDQWIEVKKRLTIGEERKALASLVAEMRMDGRITPKFENMGKAEVVAYLVEWSLRDDKGAPVRIDTDARKVAALDLLAPDKFEVIATAITEHIKRMEAERAEAKKETAGEIVSSATL